MTRPDVALLALEIIHIPIASSRCRIPVPESISIWVESAHTALVWSHTHIDILGLIHKLLLDIQCLGDEGHTSPLECVGGVGTVVCLDLDDDIVLERMWDFVACEQDRGV